MELATARADPATYFICSILWTAIASSVHSRWPLAAPWALTTQVLMCTASFLRLRASRGLCVSSLHLMVSSKTSSNRPCITKLTMHISVWSSSLIQRQVS